MIHLQNLPHCYNAHDAFRFQRCSSLSPRFFVRAAVLLDLGRVCANSRARISATTRIRISESRVSQTMAVTPIAIAAAAMTAVAIQPIHRRP
jgi:hypothetical protein